MKKYIFADYAFQFVTVTAGVLIALLIDGMVDWNNNRELVAEAHASIRREIADNFKELEGFPKVVAEAYGNVENGLKFATELLSTGKTDVRSLTLGFNLATLNQSSWQSADRTGALAHMSYDEVKQYSELYAFQDLFVDQQRKAIDLVSAGMSLTVGSDPTKASKEDLARFREQLLRLRANIYLVEQMGGQLTEAYRKFLQR